jgi:uncharacterized coiled-coil protein SlyX
MEARRRLLYATPLFALVLLPSLACESPTMRELQSQISKLDQRIAEQDQQLAGQRTTIAQLHEQLAKVRGLSDEDLQKIFSPERIEIASLSGGDDYDGKPGDDGITVYLKPLDRDGDAVKVAGDIRIELYDLANPPGQNRIGVYSIGVDQVSAYWYGKFATYHYTVRCPWQHGPPQHNEITIRVTFVDFLTQRVMTAQTVCTVNLAR